MCLHEFLRLVTKESARFDSSETKAQARLLKFRDYILSFSQCQNASE